MREINYTKLLTSPAEQELRLLTDYSYVKSNKLSVRPSMLDQPPRHHKRIFPFLCHSPSPEIEIYLDNMANGME